MWPEDHAGTVTRWHGQGKWANDPRVLAGLVWRAARIQRSGSCGNPWPGGPAAHGHPERADMRAVRPALDSGATSGPHVFDMCLASAVLSSARRATALPRWLLRRLAQCASVCAGKHSYAASIFTVIGTCGRRGTPPHTVDLAVRSPNRTVSSAGPPSRSSSSAAVILCATLASMTAMGRSAPDRSTLVPQRRPATPMQTVARRQIGCWPRTVARSRGGAGAGRKPGDGNCE